MLIFPNFNPVALQLGPLAIHWYGLAYVAALAGGLWLAKRLAARYPAQNFKPETLDDFFLWAVLGVILGGRLGYILFYNFSAYAAEPLAIFRVWEGGMAFHGGVLGVVIALLLFARRHRLHVLDLADRIAPVVPLGCLLGRLANFINGELVGRPAPEGLPWAMIFPHIDATPRHPSQLYQAALEGLLVGAIIWLVVRWWGRHGTPRGLVAGAWLVAYGLARVVGETFRTPEITYLHGTLTQGMLLSIPMVLVGLFLLTRAR
ncbi:MAG: prolipoprotein diacylglyceryl transferase [Alphaproteobacteria bacterium]|jgi:phosphatidylglycerol:prolipoprotein diacylglycerol transferase|nr:prolipoprotein diacylglyceryl transferase [Alphaproteobacteria bacterium]